MYIASLVGCVRVPKSKPFLVQKFDDSIYIETINAISSELLDIIGDYGKIVNQINISNNGKKYWFKPCALYDTQTVIDFLNFLLSVEFMGECE